ncbi:hypothetical protein [Fluviispira multicolorata]|uniref:Uncharacterized protein n=1 Tax=Fluviispira multicolorata TaxID=2654512 RepID=A0A833JBC9_9BACT|nr:hypothetical protein [Fluviispira multicolorata]KAB8028437.1 hypothetical protein GCL57_11970 [Fluviispira multicolorata]
MFPFLINYCMSEVKMISEYLNDSKYKANDENIELAKKIKLIRRKLRSGERFTKMQDTLILALNEVASSPYVARRWVKLCLSYVEFVSPIESSKEPGRLMVVLSNHPYGLSRDNLLAEFYEGYENASSKRQDSLRVCLEKVIQRARSIFIKYDLTILYCKINKKYLVSPIFNRAIK